ncbi:MAG: GNAT family N-acetyltransferase [Megasphaera sp.]|jgi:RimJ/RimL family protein N-acetyltransferase|nr:GNAT family N-acetyltransferase [Megasphaera sp.]
MKLQKATTAHKKRIMELIDEAKAFLQASGVDQWQDGYPDDKDIDKDIARSIGYVLEEEGHIIGYSAIDMAGEPAYATLKGQWLNDDPYIVVHRMAVDNTQKGKGLAQAMFREVENLAKEQDIHTIRIDTDEDNTIMRHILEKQGYTYCGTIWFANSIKIAFQKILD